MDHEGTEERPTQPVDTGRVANLMSVLEVANVLGVSERKVRRLIWRGELRSVRIGDRVLVTVEDLRAYIDSRRR